MLCSKVQKVILCKSLSLFRKKMVVKIGMFFFVFFVKDTEFYYNLVGVSGKWQQLKFKNK